MDTIDLYQTHRVDPNTPPETTLRALDDAVRRGKVRHVGTSSMYAHDLAERLRTSEREGLASFETMQNHYHLAYREEERDMLPMCDKNDIAVIPWGPLGQGYLTRPVDDLESTTRGDPENRHNPAPEYDRGGGREINARIQELAADKGVTMARSPSPGSSRTSTSTRQSLAPRASSISRTPSKPSRSTSPTRTWSISRSRTSHSR